MMVPRQLANTMELSLVRSTPAIGAVAIMLIGASRLCALSSRRDIQPDGCKQHAGVAEPRQDQISTRNPASMMAAWGILKKSGARLAIRLRNEKIEKDTGSIDDPSSRRTMVSWAM